MEDAQLYQQLLIPRVQERKEQKSNLHVLVPYLCVRHAKTLRLHMTLEFKIFEHHLHAFYHGIETFLPTTRITYTTYAANA